jgi:hypothetical protein
MCDIWLNPACQIGEARKMNIKKKILTVPLLLLFASNSMAVPCTGTASLGNLGPPGAELFGNAFTAAGAHTDCFTFSLGGTADLLGGFSVIDPLSFLNIETTLSLFEGDGSTNNQIGSSYAAGSFSFTGLTAGLYSLVADSNVARGTFGLPLPVGYSGQVLAITATLPPPTSVPEPGTLALLLAGLAGFITMRRQRVAGNSSIAS